MYSTTLAAVSSPRRARVDHVYREAPEQLRFHRRDQVYLYRSGIGSGRGPELINARAVFNSGSEINALSNMTIGQAVTDGVTFNPGSELHADIWTVTLVDSNGVVLPTLTDFNGGTVTSTQPMSLATGALSREKARSQGP